MTKCEKYEMFINDHADVAFRFMIWEEEILPKFNETKDGLSGIRDIDFDIID